MFWKLLGDVSPSAIAIATFFLNLPLPCSPLSPLLCFIIPFLDITEMEAEIAESKRLLQQQMDLHRQQVSTPPEERERRVSHGGGGGGGGARDSPDLARSTADERSREREFADVSTSNASLPNTPNSLSVSEKGMGGDGWERE